MKAVFMDRDGTINMDKHGYISTPEAFELYSFAGEAVSSINAMGFKAIIVTNQSGVARGYYTPEDLDAIHEKMHMNLKDSNAHIDAVYYCPYHKEGVVEPYNVSSSCRKPDIGMFKVACQEHDIDAAKSWMIGDKYSDIEFGHNAKLQTILVLTGNGKKEFFENRDTWKVKPDFIAPDLLTAVNLIKALTE